MGDKATLVDGGEIYQLRTADEFKKSYQWRKYTIASDEVACSFIPDDLKKQWPDRISISFGVYNVGWPSRLGYTMNPSIMRMTLENALRQADDYVWFWTETGIQWLEPGGASQDWIDAVRGAREAAASVINCKNRKKMRNL